MPAVLLLAIVLAGSTSAALAAQTAAASVPPPGATVTVYVPERVYDTRTRSFTDFEVMLADLSRADVVMVGEQHDSINSHRLESALLQGLLQRRLAVTVSLEMFERDVQPALDAYLRGADSEETFLKSSRPWPRYAADYRSLVELAKDHEWPVIAANVPRRFASDIAKTGLAPLAQLPATERALIAADLQCPKDAYFDRFAATMSEHPAGNGGSPPVAVEQQAIVERYYQSQCAKDETMAESIAASFTGRRAGGAGPIVHFTGAFHSDFGTGTVERVRRRLPGRRVAVLSMVPLASLDNLMPAGDDLTRADYVVYTLK